ncbi:MAG: glycoside hydrolase family 88 protein [Chloroflexi bacterium]|nr:glycoside hydrolase family 88 protein [Chloroflexota bacterium]
MIEERLIRAMADRTMAYPFKVWGFGEGIALEALWEAAEQLRMPLYREFVLECLERWLARPIQEADHSTPGMLLLIAYQHTGDARYLERALALAEHMARLPTDPSGAAFHRPEHPDYHHYLYVDCMEVDAPFLCQLAIVTKEHTYFDRAVDQISSYCRLLQDEATGLFYHQYNGETEQVNGAFWGRGNGWALLGLLKTLTVLPVEHAGYAALKRHFERLAQALVARQLPSGGWPTVLDRAETYQEASLPAMFGYGMQCGIAHGLLAPVYRDAVERARTAMTARLTDGLLEGVSVATPPGDAAHYHAIPTGSGFPWGQGPALLFALAQGS